MTRRQFVYGAPVATLGALTADAFALEPNWIDYPEINFGPGNSVPFTLIQLSDLHLNSIDSKHHRLAERVNSLNPHLVLITGDAIDNRDNLPILDEFLGLISPKILKTAILGNWEWWAKVNIDELFDLYARHNAKLLINSSYKFSIEDLSVTLVGVDDLVGGFPDLAASFAKVEPNDQCIVLAHCPSHFAKITKYAIENDISVQIVLSGHTHGGQVNLFGFVPFLPQGSGDYLKGWYESQGTKMYVSRGIGMTILPVRFGSRPEAPIFNYYAI